MPDLIDVPYGPHRITVSGREGDPYFDHIGMWEQIKPFLRHVLPRVFKPDFCSLDVGANIGLTSCLFSLNAPKGQVYAFEPNPGAFSSLQNTLKKTGTRNVQAFNLALGTRRGSVGFADNRVSASASHLSAGSLVDASFKVPSCTLDQFVQEENIDRVDFIKIDVEGFEMEVLRGARDTILQNRPTVFIKLNSFTLIAHGDMHPRQFVETLCETFPYVYSWADNGVVQSNSRHGILDLIHRNLTRNGCVDDLLCTFTPLSTATEASEPSALEPIIGTVQADTTPDEMATQEKKPAPKRTTSKKATYPRRTPRRSTRKPPGTGNGSN